MHFDLVDLRLVLNVAEAGSITRGAERSHLALASASARIRELEDELGAPLFERHRQGVEPTAAGHAFARHARLVLRQVEAMRAELREHGKGGSSGSAGKTRIRLWCNTSALIEHLPASLNAFMAQHPGVAVDVEERPSGEIPDAVLQGRADLGVIADFADARDLQTFPYRPDRLVLVFPQEHPRFGADAGHGGLSFADLLDEEFVGLSPGSALHRHLAQQASRLGRTIRYRVALRDFEAICRMVESGIGIAVVPESAAARCARSMAIGRAPLEDPWAARQLLLCVRDVETLGQPVRLLLAEMRA